MKLNSIPLRLIIAFGYGLFWNAVPALSVTTSNKAVESAVEDNVNSRPYRDVGAVIWPMAFKVDNEKLASSTRSVRTPESMTEAVIMIDDFWRNLANSAGTEEQDNFEEELEDDVATDNASLLRDMMELSNDETQTDEQITSRFSSDSYQDHTTDVLQPPQHLSLYPQHYPGYAPPNTPRGNYLLRPPPSPCMYSDAVPLQSFYGNAAVPGDIPVPNQDRDLDMEFNGNRVTIGRSSVAYPISVPQQSQYPLQYPPIHPQLMLNYYMMNAANFQNLHMNPGTPQYSQMGYKIPGATQNNQVSSSIPQSSYPILGHSTANLPVVSTYPFHQ